MTTRLWRIVAVLLTLAACESDLITIDGTELGECFVSCPGSGPPSVWLQGDVVTSSGEPLTEPGSAVFLLRDSIAEVFFLPDSLASEVFLIIDVQYTALGTGAVDGRFSGEVLVEDVCAGRIFAVVAVLDDAGQPVAESTVQPLLDASPPPGCPFPDARFIGGVPADTVLARDLVIMDP